MSWHIFAQRARHRAGKHVAGADAATTSTRSEAATKISKRAGGHS